MQQFLRPTEQVIGRLDEPNTGVFAAWPLSIEVDAFLLLAIYFFGMWFLYLRGVTP